MERLVIVRAFGGEPLIRAVDSVENGLIYCFSTGGKNGENEPKTYPVGFPAADVYQIEENISRSLLKQWAEARTTASDLWRSLKPYRG